MNEDVGESAPEVVTHGAEVPSSSLASAPAGEGETAPPPSKTAPQPFQCRLNALCEDFEGAPASWHSTVGTLASIGSSASPGKGAVRIDASAAGDAAYLSYERPDAVDVAWAGVFSATVKLEALGGTTRGPSLHVVRDDGILVDMSLELDAEGVHLVQETTACPETMTGCGARSDLVAYPPAMDTWTRLAIGIEIGNSATSGRVTVRVGDGDEIVRPIDVPLGEGHLSYRAGLVSAGQSGVRFDMDDVWLVVFP